MKNNRMHDVLVIGAGPAGLVMAKQLAEKGVDFKVLESNSTVGGIWNIDAPGKLFVWKIIDLEN